jgi:hypothetical protein
MTAEMLGRLTGIIIMVFVITYTVRRLWKFAQTPTSNYCGKCGKPSKVSPCAVCAGG